MIFRKGKSCLTNLIVFCDKMTGFVVGGEKWMQLTFTLARFFTCCQSDIKLTGKEGEPVSILKGMAVIQRDLVSLEEWTTGNFPRTHKDTCKVLHLQQKNPMQLYRLDTGWRATSLKKTPRSWQTAS